MAGGFKEGCGLEESFQSPGNKSRSEETGEDVAWSCQPGLTKWPLTPKAFFIGDPHEMRPVVMLETWLWWTWQSCRCYLLHLLTLAFLSAQQSCLQPLCPTKACWWPWVSWQSQLVATVPAQKALGHLRAFCAISSHPSEPSDIILALLRIHKLEICSESNCFPGTFPQSRGVRRKGPALHFGTIQPNQLLETQKIHRPGRQ